MDHPKNSSRVDQKAKAMPKPTRDLKKGRTPTRQASSGGGGSACNDHAVRDRCAARNDVIAEKQRARFPAGVRDTLSPATGAGCAPARTRGRNETRSQKDTAPGRIEISAHLDTDSRKIRTVCIIATGNRRGADGAGGKGAQRRRPAGRERGRIGNGLSTCERQDAGLADERYRTLLLQPKEPGVQPCPRRSKTKRPVLF